MFQLIVFDLDGTLIDSRRDIADSANLLIEACGGHRLPDQAIAGMVGEGAALLVARACAAAGLALPDAAVARFLEIYRTRLLLHTRPYPGTTEMLEALAGRVPLAVLTNKPLAPTRAILEGLGLARFFSERFVIGGDGPFARKPDPQALRWLAEQAGADLASTLLVGDSAIDWRTAQQAPARICLVKYGFGFEIFPTSELTGQELLIDAPDALLTLSPSGP